MSRLVRGGWRRGRSDRGICFCPRDIGRGGGARDRHAAERRRRCGATASCVGAAAVVVDEVLSARARQRLHGHDAEPCGVWSEGGGASRCGAAEQVGFLHDLGLLSGEGDPTGVVVPREDRDGRVQPHLWLVLHHARLAAHHVHRIQTGRIAGLRRRDVHLAVVGAVEREAGHEPSAGGGVIHDPGIGEGVTGGERKERVEVDGSADDTVFGPYPHRGVHRRHEVGRTRGQLRVGRGDTLVRPVARQIRGQGFSREGGQK